MSESSSKIKILAIGITICLFASLFVAARYITVSKQVTADLNDERLKSESLLSEKLQLQKEIDKFRKEIASLQGRNTELDKILAETSASLDRKEAELKSIKRDNASVRDLKKQIADLNTLRNNLEAQISSLNSNIAQLKEENGNLKNENERAQAMIAHLEKEKKGLESSIQLLSALTDDNLVQVMKKNEKLTVNSRRAKKINFTFDVPQSSLGGLEFKVVSPDSKTFTKNDGSISYHMIESDGNPVASLGTYPGQYELVQRVEMVFSPKEKLREGIYKIEVYNNGTHLGRMQVKLR